MTASITLKHGYVAAARRLASASRLAGVEAWLDHRRDRSRMAHWLRSLGAIHDLDGMVALDVPWWTYRAIEQVDAFLAARPGARVFEYGSGASTVWLARRAGEVTSVEHHPGWYARMTDVLAGMSGLAPVDLRLVEPDGTAAADPLYLSAKPGEAGQSFAGYAGAIDADPAARYDLVVIDGRARGACLAHARDRLTEGGMIVFDNSNRSRYRAAIAPSGLAVQRLRGLTPSLPYPDETTLLTRPAGAAG